MLRIGPFQFDFPVVQAALSGYSDGPMRLIARRLGAPYCLHEVMLDKSIIHSEKVRHKLLGPLIAEDHPIAGQLMGAEPAQFAEAAALLVEEGYDVIDINFGCPVKKVLGRCRGGYLLSDPSTALEILRAVRGAVPPQVPVTLKMRRGMDDELESERNFWQIFDAAFELGLAAITVHGRTVRQRYIGRANWDFLTRVKLHAGNRTVLGSGDLYTAEDVKRMLEHTGMDGVTVARGCIGNPWIFRDCRALLGGRPIPAAPSIAEQRTVIEQHYALCTELRGAELAPKIMRKFGIKYAELHPFPKDVRMTFVAVKSAEEWRAALDLWYDPNRDWPPGRRKTGPGHLIAAGACLEDEDCGEDA